MLTKTSLSAIRVLSYLGLRGSDDPVSPRHMAGQLGESPTYLAKVVRHLVKAGILRAHRGVTGGVTLNHPPRSVSLLAIVEACQGTMLGDFCTETDELADTCALHQAGVELHRAIVGVLSRWTLAQLIERPHPTSELAIHGVRCWLESSPQEGPQRAAAPPDARPAKSPDGSSPSANQLRQRSDKR